MAEFLDTNGLRLLWEKIKAWIPFLSRKTQAIPFGQVDSTSTSTAFTASIDGIDELRDGVCCYIRNDAISSSSNFTLNVNGLGAKPVYSNTEDAGRISTAWTADKTFLFVYNSSRVSGGCWEAYYGNTSVDESNLVHKTGAETIAGSKTFTNDIHVVDSSLVIDSNNQNKRNVVIELGNYYDDGGDGVAVLALDDPSGNGDVIVRYVSSPIQNDDATNKVYVDNAIQTNDSTVVHKAGAETITGGKTFTAGVTLKDSDLVFLTGQDEGAYIQAGENGGKKMFMFADIEDDSPVLLSNIEKPIQNNDAVNKEYVDGYVSSLAPWNKRISLPSDVVLSSGGHLVSVTMNTQSTTPPRGVYMVCGQAMILNPNPISQQGHAILRYRLSSNGNYVYIAATSFTVSGARTSTYGGTYGASSVFIQGLVTLSVKPSYIEFQLAVDVETDGSDSILAASAPTSGSYADVIDPVSVNNPSATNLVIYKIGIV